MRRIPGPANNLEEEDNNYNNNNKQQDNEEEDEEELEINYKNKSNNFIKINNMLPWKTLCHTLGFQTNEMSQNNNERISKDIIPFTILDINNGNSDLRVAKLAAIVLSVVHTPSGIWTLTLTDHSQSTIEAFVSPKAVEQQPPILTPGTAILAQNVAIFVSSPSCKRILNLHERCIIAVFPAQDPLSHQYNSNHYEDFLLEDD